MNGVQIKPPEVELMTRNLRLEELSSIDGVLVQHNSLRIYSHLD